MEKKVTQDILQGLFETCGKITYIRLAGDDTHPSRFAFIEFLTKEAAQEAMGMNGKILVDRPLKYFLFLPLFSLSLPFSFFFLR